MKKISLSFIAEEAGISKGVASAVLSKQENKKIFASNKTKEKILGIAQKYNYVLPKSGKELVSGRSDTIGVIFHTFTPFFGELLTEIQKQAFKKGLDVSIYFTDHKKQMEEQFLQQSRDGRVDGLIILGWVDKESIERYKKYSSSPYNLKILNYGFSNASDINFPTIHFDEVKAGIFSYQHLKEIGCRTFGVFGGPPGNTRIDSFCDEAEKYGKKPVYFPEPEFVGSWEEERLLVKKFFESIKTIPEGIFCYNDLYALGFISEAQNRGVKIPDDIAVIGCDNTQICFYSEPTLTSISTHKEKTAEKAIEIMINLINGKKIKSLKTLTPVSLIKRKSTQRR